MELLEGIASREAVWVTGALVAAVTALVRFRRGWLSMSIRKTDRLYRLVSAKNWRKVDGTALQLAVEQAFGIHMDDREIRSALGRHDALGRLRARVRAAHLIRWDSSEQIYRDDRMIKSMPLVFWRRLHWCLFLLSLLFVVVFAFLVAQAGFKVAGIALAESLVFVWLAQSKCRDIRAAEKLLDPQAYPLAAQTEIEKQPRRGRRRTRRDVLSA